MSQRGERTPGALYFLSVFSFFPILGAISGGIMLALGLTRHKDKWLIIIGAFGISVSVLFFSVILYQTHFSKSVDKQWADISQGEINKIANIVEVYKIKYRVYPDSLEQARLIDPYLSVVDPLQTIRLKFGIKCVYVYKKIGDKYTLYSIGIDHIPRTSDDIYPQMGADSASFGLIIDTGAVPPAKRDPPRLLKLNPTQKSVSRQLSFQNCSNVFLL